MIDLTKAREILLKRRVEYDAASLAVRKEAMALVDAEDALMFAQEAQRMIQAAAQSIQQEAHGRIAAIVTRCLQAVFDDPYEFQILFEQKRGKTEASLVFVRAGLVFDNPIRQVGHGPVDVAAFALRLACLVLKKPRLRRFVSLDEPFRNIRGRKYRDRVRNLLESLARDFNMQFVINIDHEAYPQFLLGKVVELG